MSSLNLMKNWFEEELGGVLQWADIVFFRGTKRISLLLLLKKGSCDQEYFLDGLPDSALALMGSCRGLICLQSQSFNDSKTVYLFDPFTRQTDEFVLSSLDTTEDLVYGMGFVDNGYQLFVGSPKASHLYSFDTNSWLLLPEPFPSVTSDHLKNGIYLRGVLYWLCRSGFGRFRIIGFEFHSYTFLETPLPRLEDHIKIQEICILDGKLCLVYRAGSIFSVIAHFGDGVWHCLFRQKIKPETESFVPLKLSTNGNLLVSIDNQSLQEFNINSDISEPREIPLQMLSWGFALPVQRGFHGGDGFTVSNAVGGTGSGKDGLLTEADLAAAIAGRGTQSFQIDPSLDFHGGDGFTISNAVGEIGSGQDGFIKDFLGGDGFTISKAVGEFGSGHDGLHNEAKLAAATQKKETH